VTVGLTDVTLFHQLDTARRILTPWVKREPEMTPLLPPGTGCPSWLLSQQVPLPLPSAAPTYVQALQFESLSQAVVQSRKELVAGTLA
jgi:hypothetical protein